jgi:hypothetical protein
VYTECKIKETLRRKGRQGTLRKNQEKHKGKPEKRVHKIYLQEKEQDGMMTN